MRDELLAYLFDDVDPEQRQRIEYHLEHDPTWQAEYEKLKQCIEAHEAPPEKTTCPPRDLVKKTCKFVQDSAIRTKGSIKPASLSENREGCGKSSRWSLADMLVAAAILLAVGALLMPALAESRRTARRLQCQSNLRDIATSLNDYQEIRRQGLPHVGLEENAGIFVVKLAGSGVIDREKLAHLLVCPSTKLAEEVFQGTVVMKIPTPEEMARMDREALTALKRNMAGDYAYQFGYIDEHDEYVPMPFAGRRDLPMIGDRPNMTAGGWQSSNHGECGQNIASQDCSVKFTSRCKASKSNIGHPFLNDEGEHAAGRGRIDSVLGRSEATPSGRLISLEQ